MKSDDLIGKQMLAFKFEDGGNPLFTDSMLEIVGKVGTIERIHDECCYVIFSNSEGWWYPYPQILKHLIEEEPEVEMSLDELINNVKNLISKI
jgi:hypothetical protein